MKEIIQALNEFMFFGETKINGIEILFREDWGFLVSFHQNWYIGLDWLLWVGPIMVCKVNK